MSIKDDFPIGCEVEPANSEEATIMNVKLTGKGKVVGYAEGIDSSGEEKFLLIDWGDGRRIDPHYDGWYAFRCKRVSTSTKNISSQFCSCGSSNVVWNSALGQKFLYCRNCGKERK